MESAGLPGLCIYTQNEDVSIDAMGPTRTVGRDLELIVEDDPADTSVKVELESPKSSSNSNRI